MSLDGTDIEGTNYTHGYELQRLTEIDCPEKCEVPTGCRLVQAVIPGTSFSIRCPNDCGLALRVV